MALRRAPWVLLVAVICGSCGASPSGTSTARPTSAAPAGSPAIQSIEGRVTDEAGQPLDTVQIQFSSASGNWSAFTVGDGTYSMSPPAGTYTLHFSDFSGSHAGGYLGSSGLVNDVSAARSITLAAADVAGLDVVLPAGHTVSGRLAAQDGTALGGFLLELVSPGSGAIWPDGQVVAPPLPTTRTAADGTFTLRAVATGDYALAIQNPDRQATGYYVAPSGFSTGPQPHPFTVGADITNLEIRVPAAFVSARVGHRVDGRVTDVHGNGVPGVPVMLATTANALVATGTTASDGTYVLGGIEPGQYGLSFGGYSRLTGGQIDATPITVGTMELDGVDGGPWLPDGGLWTTLPTHVSGVSLTVQQFRPWASPELLATLGKTTADVLEVAVERDHPTVFDARAAAINVDASRIRGTDPASLRAAWSAVMRGRCPQCSVAEATIAGKAVVVATLVGSLQTTYAYGSGDVLVEISSRSSDLADAALAALP